MRQWSTKRDFLSLGKDDGLLYVRYKIGKDLVNQVVFPDALIPFVLRLKYDNAGHMAAEKTSSLIRCEYFWLNMVRDVINYCRSCGPCARNRPSPSHACAGLTLSSQPQEPWQKIAMDIKGPFGRKPTKRGNRYVLVLVDLLTHTAEMIPTPDKSAKTVANAIVVKFSADVASPSLFLTTLITITAPLDTRNFTCPMGTFLVPQDWFLRPSPRAAHLQFTNGHQPIKAAHSNAVSRDSQAKQRRVAQNTEDPTPLHVGDSVMMHVQPRPGFPSKLQSRWQGPFIVVKCLQGNTYRIKQANNFRKRFLRHRDQLRVLRACQERLRPTQGKNGSGHTEIVPPVPAMLSQPVVRPADTSSHPQNSRAED